MENVDVVGTKASDRPDIAKHDNDYPNYITINNCSFIAPFYFLLSASGVTITNSKFINDITFGDRYQFTINVTETFIVFNVDFSGSVDKFMHLGTGETIFNNVTFHDLYVTNSFIVIIFGTNRFNNIIFENLTLKAGIEIIGDLNMTNISFDSINCHGSNSSIIYNGNTLLVMINLR